ncbi:hypothetical protein SAMN02745898_11614 [Streptomyces sp. 136MFCol5.1]|jgi:hypothetical protein|nr:hypothetical protein SAMN02745898_11614 [Streptomyces sp. 136MFCol5.1]SFT30307.1 hypothetical protein SAMN04487982_115181 [Streptomyces sp. ok210]
MRPALATVAIPPMYVTNRLPPNTSPMAKRLSARWSAPSKTLVNEGSEAMRSP